MPTFIYRVKTRQGGIRRGKLEAVDQSAALRALRQQDLFVTRIREKPVSPVQGWSFPGPARVSQNDLMVFTHQLEALIKAGVPLSQGLEMLATQASSSALQAVIRAVKLRVESGSSLAGALQGHPAVFTPWYVSMVEAGEESGTLDQTFGRVAEHLDKVVRLRQQVKLALAYPLLVVVVAVLVLWVLLLWVIPMFATLFADWGVSFTRLARRTPVKCRKLQNTCINGLFLIKF